MGVAGVGIAAGAATPAVAVSGPTVGSSVSAGGFVNVVGVSPDGDTAIAGTDVAGVFRSTSTPVGAMWGSVNEDIMAETTFAETDHRARGRRCGLAR